MVKEFSTIGSCSSRLLFNSSVNYNYKQFFHINESLEVVSIISLMSNPILFDETLLDSDDKFDNECAFKDLSKCFLNFLKKDKIDYLLLDTYFDVECDVIVFDENSFLSDSGRLSKTSYYKTLSGMQRISIFKDFDKFMELWTKACDSFFEFLNKNCPNTKIILNIARGACYYLDENNIKLEFDNADYIRKSNEFRDILEVYILENFDVDILPFGEDMLAFKNHFAHLHPVHYEDRYYKECTQYLNEIVGRNDNLGYDAAANAEYRKNLRDKTLFNFKIRNDWLNIGHYEGSMYDSLVKYKALEIKLNQMLDEIKFKNRYELECSIFNPTKNKNNNFEPHEDVALKVVVYGANHNIVPNVVVEFLENNNLIGLVPTNNDGIATLTKSFHETGIYNIVARVSNTEFGKAIPIFIKDFRNRATLNQWSMGDYASSIGLNSLNGINYNKCGGNISISTDFSDIGHHCLKLFKPANDAGYTFANIEIPVSKNDIGKKLTVKVKAFKNSNQMCFFNLFKTIEGKDIFVKNVEILDYNHFRADFVLDFEKISSDISHFQLRFQISSNTEDVSLFVDNLRVYID